MVIHLLVVEVDVLSLAIWVIVICLFVSEPDRGLIVINAGIIVALIFSFSSECRLSFRDQTIVLLVPVEGGITRDMIVKIEAHLLSCLGLEGTSQRRTSLMGEVVGLEGTKLISMVVVVTIHALLTLILLDTAVM